MRNVDEIKTEYYSEPDEEFKTVSLEDELPVRNEDDIRTEYVGSRSEDDIRTEYAGATKDRHIPGKMAASSFHRCYHCFFEYGEKVEEKCPRCGNPQNSVPKVNCHLYPGTVLQNRIVIGDVEGFGGFGITYRAWDLNLKTMVAVKEYFNNKVVRRAPGETKVEIQRGKDEQYQEEMLRFLKEARYTAQFRDCPNIVYVYDIFEENGTAYMVMEFLEGRTLLKEVRNHGAIQWEKAVDIIEKVALAASALHKKSVIHRDISPDNIFTCDDGRIKLVDLGAAKFPDGVETGLRIVKPGFAPPEQYRENGEIGPWTDVYALAATLYYIITGIHPEESTNRTKENDIEIPSKVVEGLPKYLDKTIMRGIDTDPRLRFRSMDDFRSALMNQGKVLDSEDFIRKRKRRRLFGIVAAAVIMVVGSLAVFSGYRNAMVENLREETELIVWIPIREGDSGRVDIYREMSQEFTEAFPKILVSVEGIPEAEYFEKVSHAVSSGEVTLFEKRDLDSFSSKDCADVSSVMEELEKESFYIDDGIVPEKTIPLGFKALSAYGNVAAEKTGMAIGIQQFLSGEGDVCVGDTSDFYEIQDSLPGSYMVLPLPADEMRYCYTNIWCVSTGADEMQKAAAGALLRYWLGETAQDILHIRHRDSLPVNVSEFAVFQSVFSEFSNLAPIQSDQTVAENEFEQQKSILSSRPDIAALLEDGAAEE